MVVRPLNESTYLRLHSQQFEIVAGDRPAIDTSYRVTPAQSRITKSVITGQITEGGVLPAIVFKRRVGCSEEFAVSPRLEAKLVEILRVAHIERVQQDRVHHSEDDNVCPNCQHQGEQGYNRKRWRLPKDANCVPNVQQQVLHRTSPNAFGVQ